MGIFSRMFKKDLLFSVTCGVEMFNYVASCEKKENVMNNESRIQKLVNIVNNGNKGMVIKCVGVAADGEIKIVTTSRNAKAYNIMKKNGLAEIYFYGVHYYYQDESFEEREKKEIEKFDAYFNGTLHYFQLIDFGVPEYKAEQYVLMAAERKELCA